MMIKQKLIGTVRTTFTRTKQADLDYERKVVQES